MRALLTLLSLITLATAAPRQGSGFLHCLRGKKQRFQYLSCLLS